ncbi:HPr(Ser) kinase/phosphatase [Bacillus benzoevorans]|uniref:HPr kinase/phosphorylase n=1 Tax=Bacillus benzoevorans TaxID=1456 RepID=A0A7X0LVT7_9BACI|nr:HPr(Ser) kinase/phosphatase [Bacillus benzoevorans]MBB6446366.1 HPr kinase/phosphorylase [Bacillus benzoevorans]
MNTITVRQLVDKLKLEIVAGEEGLDQLIDNDDIHRPGLELTGYFKYFPSERIQLLGRQEITYLHSLTKAQRDERIGNIIKEHPPCIIITRNQEGLSYLIKHCNEEGVALLRAKEKTTRVIGKLNSYLEKELAKSIGIHAVCMNVFGVGLLIRGESGIGKSEAALSLIEKGHRLIADDLVILKRIDLETLIGTHNQTNRDFLSLRGIGMINVPRLYGSGAFQDETSINLDIILSAWDVKKYYDGIETTKEMIEYLDVPVPHIEIPIRPGRDIASLIEVAAKNWRLEQQGYTALNEFYERIENM